MCDFTNSKLNQDKLFTKFLYRMLTELMTILKTMHTTENLNLIIVGIFSLKMIGKIKYTFMDNGIGIPTTVFKNFMKK